MFECYEFETCEYNAQPKCCLPDGMECPHGVASHEPSDIEKLIEQLHNLEACAYGYHINGEVLGVDCSDFEQIMVDAADKISTIPALQAENAKLRYEVERQRRSADDRKHLYENAERAYIKVQAELEQYHALGPIDHLRELAWADREGIAPCTFCRFNPPSSGDGKPCTCCPATGRPPEGEVDA